MWFLAWRELRHSPAKFGVIAGLVAIIALLVGVLTGLASGLGSADVSGVQKLPGTIVVFQSGARHDLSASSLSPAQLEMVSHLTGVHQAIPIRFALTDLNGKTTAEIAMHGVASVSVARHGSIQHAPVAYVPYGPASGKISAILVTGDPASLQRINERVPGAEAVTKAVAVRDVPGYSAETGTVGLIRGFLFGVSAALIGVVFWVLTLQKEGQLAVLRATGAGTRLLTGAYLIQVSIVTAAGAVTGGVASLLAGRAMPGDTFDLSVSALATAMTVLIALALAGSVAALRRLLTVDPMLSLGRTA